MATVEDYGSGRILRSIRQAHRACRLTGIPFLGPAIQKQLELRMVPFAIRPITLDEAGRIIGCCRDCAVGPRICQPLFPESERSEAVFLDALAGRMAEAGKARKVTPEQALETLRQYPGNPLILSKVSGQYLEICRSVPSVCIYWKMRRIGLKV
jgi:hypothetical protein